MFELDTECPSCSSGEYKGDFSFRHFGSAKLLFECETYCEKCEYTNEYTTALQ